MNKLSSIIISLFFTLSVSLGVAVVYDTVVITPKINEGGYRVVDIDRIFAEYEQKVRKGELKLDDYRKRLIAAEEYIGTYPLVINKKITQNGSEYPVVFGGRDITGEVLERMEAVK